MEIRTRRLFTLIDIRFRNKINISYNYFFPKKQLINGRSTQKTDNFLTIKNQGRK